MAYETEKTMLVQFIYDKDDKVNKIIPIPKRIIIICDLFKGSTQFIIPSEDLKDVNTEKDLKYIAMAITNDPYASSATDFNNLGYFKILWVLGFGVVTNNYPLTYVSNDIQTLEIRENIPLRHPNRLDGDRGIKFLKEDYNTYQIIEYNFDEDLTKDVLIKYSVWNYKEQIGKMIQKKINLFSTYNKSELIINSTCNNLSELYKFHNFKKIE